MSWTLGSKELPPRLDYSQLDEPSRRLAVKINMSFIRAEFALYRRTGNGAHMWRCYQLWRRRLPNDLPLPRELSEYFDRCADAIATETDPDLIKQAMELLKLPSPGAMTDHGGGPSGATAADPTRRQQAAMDSLRAELFRAQTEGRLKGHRKEICKRVAATFGYDVSTIYKLKKVWGVDRAVNDLFREWRDRKGGEN